MSYFAAGLGAALGKRTIAVPGPPPAVEGTILERIDAINGGPTRHWRQADTSGSVMVARVGGVNGTWQNTGDLTYGVDPLTTDAASGKSIGFGGAASPGHGQITIGGAGISIASQHTFHQRIQLDRHKAQHVALTTGQQSPTNPPGSFAREFVDDGAGGMKPRMWTINASNVVVAYTGTAPGTVPVGESFGVDWIQENGALRVRINGVEIPLSLNTGTPPATWAAAPAGILYVGVWEDLTSAPLEGLASELSLWNSYVFTAADSASLDIPQDVVWLSNQDAGAIQVNITANIILHSHPASGFTVSILSQGSRGTASVDGEQVDYAAGATPGLNDTFTVSITKGSITSRTATITIDVAAASTPLALPYFGLFFGTHSMSVGIANNRMKDGTDPYESVFFYAEKTGTPTHVQWHWRWDASNPGGYSQGTGGSYIIGIKTANPATKFPTVGAAYICRTAGGANPSNSGAAAHNFFYAFTTTGQIVAKQPYCLVIQNTHASPASNFLSTNGSRFCGFTDNTAVILPGSGAGVGGRSINVATDGINPDNVGASPAKVIGFTPVKFDGTVMFPYPIGTQDGGLRENNIGCYLFALQYSDGQFTNSGAMGSEEFLDSYKYDVTGSTQFRIIFRPYLATHIVSGVFILGYLASGTGNINVDLNSGPTTDSHNPASSGTLIERVTVNSNLWLNAGSAQMNSIEDWPTPGNDLDLAHWVWVPFSTNRTLTQNSAYNLRLSATSSARIRFFASNRNITEGEIPGNIQGRSTSTWATWIANNKCSWNCWPYSRGCAEESTNGGSSWTYKTGEMPPILFKCV